MTPRKVPKRTSTKGSSSKKCAIEFGNGDTASLTIATRRQRSDNHHKQSVLNGRMKEEERPDGVVDVKEKEEVGGHIELTKTIYPSLPIKAIVDSSEENKVEKPESEPEEIGTQVVLVPENIVSIVSPKVVTRVASEEGNNDSASADGQQRKRWLNMTPKALVVTEKEYLKMLFTDDGYGISRYFAEREERVGRHEMAMKRRMHKLKRESQKKRAITSDEFVGYFGDKPVDAILLAIEGDNGGKTKHCGHENCKVSSKNIGSRTVVISHRCLTKRTKNPHTASSKKNGKTENGTEEKSDDEKTTKEEEGAEKSTATAANPNKEDAAPKFNVSHHFLFNNGVPVTVSKLVVDAGGGSNLHSDESLADDSDFVPVIVKSKKKLYGNHETGCIQNWRTAPIPMRYRKFGGPRRCTATVGRFPRSTPIDTPQNSHSDGGKETSQSQVLVKTTTVQNVVSEGRSDMRAPLYSLSSYSPLKGGRCYAAVVACSIDEGKQSQEIVDGTVSESNREESLNESASNVDVEPQIYSLSVPPSSDLHFPEDGRQSESGSVFEEENCGEVAIANTQLTHISLSCEGALCETPATNDRDCVSLTPISFGWVDSGEVPEAVEEFKSKECVAFVGQFAVMSAERVRELETFSFFYNSQIGTSQLSSSSSDLERSPSFCHLSITSDCPDEAEAVNCPLSVPKETAKLADCSAQVRTAAKVDEVFEEFDECSSHSTEKVDEKLSVKESQGSQEDPSVHSVESSETQAADDEALAEKSATTVEPIFEPPKPMPMKHVERVPVLYADVAKLFALKHVAA